MELEEKRCELCGTPVKVVGHTTKHYEPISNYKVLEKVAEICKQPQADKRIEDWESRFDEKFDDVFLDYKGYISSYSPVTKKEKYLQGVDCDKLELEAFIADEIKKAEKRGFKSGIDYYISVENGDAIGTKES